VKIGDRVKFPFAKKELEGTVEKIFTKTAYIKVDMPNQKGKTVKRKIKDLKA
jgi:hypothetical protein